jgi:hypothetical protein
VSIESDATHDLVLAILCKPRRRGSVYELETTEAVRGGGKGGATHFEPPVLLGPLECHDSLPTLEQLGLHNNPKRPVPCDCLLFVRKLDFLTCRNGGGGDGEDVRAVEGWGMHRGSRQLVGGKRNGRCQGGRHFRFGRTRRRRKGRRTYWECRDSCWSWAWRFPERVRPLERVLEGRRCSSRVASAEPGGVESSSGRSGDGE